MAQNAPPGGRKPSEPNAMSLLGAGVELGGVVAALTLLGWWLDQKAGLSPWLTLTGMTIGIVGGLYNLYRSAKRFF